jgi:peptide-methionine (R)-S-oxide reductase
MNLKKLSNEEARVILHKGTEAPFSGEFYENNRRGKYFCKQCGAELFTSDDQFDSGCGWPSYSLPIQEDVIAEHRDTSLGMVRVEVRCKNCDAHLGHVFDDGPQPSGLRYCINSASLKFEPSNQVELNNPKE